MIELSRRQYRAWKRFYSAALLISASACLALLAAGLYMRPR